MGGASSVFLLMMTPFILACALHSFDRHNSNDNILKINNIVFKQQNNIVYISLIDSSYLYVKYSA